MSLFKKLGALMLIVIAFVCTISLTSCGSSGVDASLTAVSTATRVTVTATFGTNKNLKSGDAVPHVRQYKYNSDTEKYEYDNVDTEMTFSNDIYTTSKQVFSSLDESTKYKFKLFITYKSKDKKEAEVECTTKASNEATAISTIEEFEAMSDDLNGDYILTADLDFDSVTDSTFTSPFSAKEIFKGTFNGNGHTISNITFDSNVTTNSGVFAYTDGAMIFDLNLKNLSVDYTNGLGSINFGSLVGNAKNTVIYNVNVDGLEFKAQANSTSVINLGGLVGLSDGSTVINSNVTNSSMYFNRLRCKVSAGGLIGQAIKYNNESLTTIKEAYSELIQAAKDANLETTDSLAYLETQCQGTKASEKLLAYDCKADNSFGGVLYFMSKTDSGDAFAHVGGFIGDISTTNLVYDCIGIGSINVTRTEGSADNRFSVAFGGFFGINYTGTVKLESCLADTTIDVFAGSNPLVDESLSDDEKNAKINNLLETPLCYSKDVEVDTDKKKYEAQREYAYIGGFGGKINEFVSTIENCIVCSEHDSAYIINLYASGYRPTTDTEYTTITETDWYIGKEIGETCDFDDFLCTITKIHPDYYTITATLETVTSDTFVSGTYYTSNDDVYTLATEFNENETYFKLVATLDDNVSSTTDFTTTTYYTLDNNSYTPCSAYEDDYQFGIAYLFTSSTIGRIDVSQDSRIGTIEEMKNVTDTSVYGENVKAYLA
ncbi:MAG: hypothetical protein K6E20_03610 [Acholeplasmatales bacterium]|nr:hypothetical protein [Acholeplasmatales bacterium]